MTNGEVRNPIQDAIGAHDDLLNILKLIWSHLGILWHGEDNSAGNSERSKKEKIDEEMGGHAKELTRNGFGQEQMKMKRCKVIGSAPTTVTF